MDIKEMINEVDFYQYSFDKLKSKLEPEELKKQLLEINNKMLEADFWKNHEIVEETVSVEKSIKNKLSLYKEIQSKLEDITTLIEMYKEEKEQSLLREIENLLMTLGKNLEKLEISFLLVEEFDHKDAIFELHTGAGGADAADFCEMLFRMYTRYFDKKGYKTKLLHYIPNEEAGIKNAIIKVSGENAYGFLKSENGVHRLIRISPFNSQGKRQTSFASVVVTPEIDENINIEIKDEDIKIDTFRASGAGGQSVNTTDSAVRITHKKTNIVVSCQNERSQIQNRETALQILKSKLYHIEIVKNKDRINKMRKDVKDISFGNHIRSYVMHPYSMVKDHRTNEETGEVNKVLDGDLDKFIYAYLHEFS